MKCGRCDIGLALMKFIALSSFLHNIFFPTGRPLVIPLVMCCVDEKWFTSQHQEFRRRCSQYAAHILILYYCIIYITEIYV